MEEYDLLIVADATASMTQYLSSLNASLPQIISISAITGCFSRIGIIAYRDYTDYDCIEWSDWLHLAPADTTLNQPDLASFARSLEASGGGDYPEAAKTGLAKAYSLMRADAKTIILLYTDAPPHAISSDPSTYSNAELELEALAKPESVDGYGPRFRDWVSVATMLSSGERRAQVFALLEPYMLARAAAYYTYLCSMTEGACIRLDDAKPETISKATVDLLLAWMGVQKLTAGSATERIPGVLLRYASPDGIRDVKDEEDPEGLKFFPTHYTRRTAAVDNTKSLRLEPDIVANELPKKDTPAEDPTRRWSTDPTYQSTAARHLMRIIDEDLQAIAINPVFGSLWRAVCQDRTYDGRDSLVNAFSKAVERITDPKEKEVMKNWLEESYDFSAEVQAIVDQVPEAERFPCVFLDPTISFGSADVDKDGKSPETLTRADLLEISRSCDPRILRRLGRILTRLTYVEDATQMPAHIAKSNSDQVAIIPLTLATQKYKKHFWKILLHTIVPGTRLSARAAALLAALSIRLGIPFLKDVAEKEMLSYKSKWNNIEVPETWAVACLTLLLDADAAYKKTLNTPDSDEMPVDKPSSLLEDSDARLFEHLVAFKTLEHNLDTPLAARVPWTPNKAISQIGPLAKCRQCKYLRSVTMMGKGGKCGICLATDLTPEGYDRLVNLRVSRGDNSSSNATWVECSASSCRAQYIVYDVDGLNVRAKCWYCREQGSATTKTHNVSRAPVVDCSKCANRMIWPEAYRPARFDASKFVCPPCESGRETSTDLQTSARALANENTLAWLVQDLNQLTMSPFTNRSVYHTVSTMGTKEFQRRIKLFPKIKKPLTRRGKPIQNTEAIVSTLKDHVAKRESAKADCSLCFSSFWPSALNPACGRRGCLQRICMSCSTGWYGSNATGSIINTAALACPFCRRLPTPQTLSKYGKGIHAVKDLSRAIENHGSWIYAWCAMCASAKEFVARDCARGQPPELRDWRCEICVDELARATAGKPGAIHRDLRMKPCPKCGTMTEKISGCGHIECPVESCGAHWCYFCGKEQHDIYHHMTSVHGGIYDHGDEEYDDYDEVPEYEYDGDAMF
ncbi:hypothetical protein BJY01DRAFT_126335 [Aspergillus pseudoustus]|uniref:RBR-type E3 ubiquitin transferase n=1 Tax=Aspergillus pseudoustus TaxID=1810923 RepID=A0ABR4IMY8_9EURO